MKFDEPDGATPLDPDEIGGLKFDHITTRGELDELEQANITQALRWLGRRRGGDILTEDFLRTLHRRLFGEVVLPGEIGGTSANLSMHGDPYDKTSET